MSVAKALYDFNLDAGFENCMTFHAGDIVHIIEKRDDGWWQGSSETSIGWFPGNYMEELPPPPTPEVDDAPPPPPPEEPAFARAQQEPAKPVDLTQGLASVAAAKKAKANKRKSRAFIKARAMIDFVPNAYDDDAIGFKKGEEIVIFEQNPTGQWKGKNADGRVGYFPNRYVSLVDSDDEDDDDDDDDDDLPVDGLSFPSTYLLHHHLLFSFFFFFFFFLQ